MKVLQIVPAENTAITTLAVNIMNHNKGKCDIKILTFHPKKPSASEISMLRKSWGWADLIDVQYWKSGAKVKELYKNLWNTKPKVLTHHNPYNLHEEKWDDYKEVIVVNNYQKSELPKSRLVPLCVDMDFFNFGSSYANDKSVNMVVNRIEGNKGVLEVAIACRELGYKFNLVGRVSDGTYMNAVTKEGGPTLDFKNGVSDQAVRQSYYDSSIHVCNSKDNFEAGTLPMLEAMACGTPVLSRLVGHVPDIYNGHNICLNKAEKSDKESLKILLGELMEDESRRLKMREIARDSIKHRTSSWRAEEYLRIYKSLIGR